MFLDSVPTRTYTRIMFQGLSIVVSLEAFFFFFKNGVVHVSSGPLARMCLTLTLFKVRACKLRAGITEADDRQVTIVQPSFHHRHSTEYHVALPSSASNEVRCDCTFADDGKLVTLHDTRLVEC